MKEYIAHSGTWALAIIMIVIASWILYRFLAPKTWREWAGAGLAGVRPHNFAWPGPRSRRQKGNGKRKHDETVTHDNCSSAQDAHGAAVHRQRAEDLVTLRFVPRPGQLA